MADSDAVRQLRRRRHRQGDHSMCTRHCKDARPTLKIAELPVGTAGNLDPAAAMADLARALMVAYRADPANAALARELRATLQSLPGARDAGVEDEMAAFIRTLSIPVQAESPYPPGFRGTAVDPSSAVDDDGR
jgi:hypothetical protein